MQGKRRALTIGIGSIVLALTAQTSTAARTLQQIRDSGELVVVTRNAPTSVYIDRNGRRTGPEYEMVEAFAEWLGVNAVYRQYVSTGAVLEALEAGAGDLAAAGLTITPERRQRLLFAPPYQRITQQVVCRRDTVQPENLRELARVDRLHVVADSSYAELLEDLAEQGYPVPPWRAVPGVGTDALLRAVWNREIDCTIADSHIAAINQRYYPELLSPMNLSREQNLAWAMPPDAHELDAAVSRWLQDYRAAGRLDDLHEKYYGFFEAFDYVDVRYLIRRTDQRFPRYREWFREAAEAHDLSFVLLAAQAYQESHWRENARSPTGVRGIMMLTRVTAEEVGVSDRLDPRQSIFGGAAYMARMKERFADEVTEPDRTFLALAAYNVGRAHLHDAQVLARRHGLSPWRWRDIKRMLPLLSDPEYYRTLKYGYARGHEPVRYVQRIREYHHVLANELADDLPTAIPHQAALGTP
jgi:membrane-bound lytic murein transglycosylase F